MNQRHLANNIPVGESNDHPVLGRVVLVLVLDDETLAGEVVRLPLCREKKNPKTTITLRPVTTSC